MKNTLAKFCFFLSGFAGLVYEVAWIRKASLIFGSTTWALTTVLAVFFGGMALGSWVFGRWGQRLKQPIRMYAVLEVLIAAAALLSPKLFDLVDGLYGSAYRGAVQTVTDADGLQWLASGAGLSVVRVILVALVLLVPTFLMGGTLPLFCRQFVVSREKISGSIAYLYSLNTIGAAAGAAAAGFILIPRLGVVGAITVAAGISLAVGLTASALRFAPAQDTPDDLPLASIGAKPFFFSLVPWLFFTTGMVAVGVEVFWSRFLGLLIRNSVYTYTITLAVVLLGIVIGSLLAGVFTSGKRNGFGAKPGTLFGVFQVTSAVAIVVLMFLPANVWQGLGTGLTPIFLLLLPAAILSGASFPLANKLVLDNPALSSLSVGRMTAMNTVGGILGAFLAGFVLLPVLGLAKGVLVLTGAGLVAGVVALLRLDCSGKRPAKLNLIMAAGSVLLWVLIPILAGTSLPEDYLQSKGKLVDFVEGSGSTLAVVEVDGSLKLKIDGLWQGSETKGHQIMAAHIPAILHPDPKDILVVGVGVGQTAGRFLMHPINTLDCVDIEREIFPFIAKNFETEWMHDPRVTLVPDDGRTFTNSTSRRYDIVSVEVGQVFRPGVDAFYSKEYYESVRSILKPGGMVAQFVPLGFFDESMFKSTVATFCSVFPEAVLWYNTQELLLIGSPQGQPQVSLERMFALEQNKPLVEDLAWSQWGGSEFYLNKAGAFLGGYLLGPDQLAHISENVSLFTDDHPVLAYATSSVQERDHREVGLVKLISSHLAPLGSGLELLEGTEASEELMALANKTRKYNIRDIVASGMVSDVVNGKYGQPGTQTRAMLGVLNKALEQNPHSCLVQQNIGRVYLLAGQFPEAERYLLGVAKLQPDNGIVLRDLGLIYLQTGKTERALKMLLKGSELIPDDFAVHNYLGAVYGGMGDFKAAVKAFERALALNPADEAAKQNLARAQRDANF
jgi:spermidine synthase